MSEFKVGNKVVWIDKEYAKRWFPDTVDMILTVSNVESILNDYLRFHEFSNGESVLAKRFKKYNDKQDKHRMKIRVNTNKYEYMGLKKGEVVDTCPMSDGTFQFDLNGKIWILDHKDVMVMDIKQDHIDEFNIVDKPKHYSFFPEHDIEAIDIAKVWLSRWEHDSKMKINFYQASILKEMLYYVLRSPLKNELEDLKKARFYLNEAIEEMEKAE